VNPGWDSAEKTNGISSKPHPTLEEARRFLHLAARELESLMLSGFFDFRALSKQAGSLKLILVANSKIELEL
jgi:hypothetical protein